MLILKGMQILQHNHWIKNHSIIIENEYITDLIPDNQIVNNHYAQVLQFSANDGLLPGFIDMHLHGLNNVDVMDDETENNLAIMSESLASEGVTSFLATTLTASDQHIERILKNIEKIKLTHSKLIGIHLEGPFIAKDKCGAHEQNLCQLPNIEKIKHWQALSYGLIKIVTFAPELKDSEKFISTLLSLNIIPSIGHTNASFENAQHAILKGVKHATHIFNAMSSLHHRHPGAILSFLLEDKIKVELIADGIHVHPAMIDLLYRLKGKDSIFLVSDSMRGKGMKEGEYLLGNLLVTVKQNKVSLADGTLAGSVLSFPTAIKNIMNFTGCSLAEASQMASSNQAKTLGLSSQGTIAKNKFADLVVLNKNLEVLITISQGKIIFAKEKFVQEENKIC